MQKACKYPLRVGHPPQNKGMRAFVDKVAPAQVNNDMSDDTTRYGHGRHAGRPNKRTLE